MVTVVKYYDYNDKVGRIWKEAVMANLRFDL
jgi:hypothetical protein